jgi:hypothetical protein
MPTKGAKMAKELVGEGDVSGRTALNIIRGAGSQALREANKAIRQLKLYNRGQMYSSMAQSAAKAAVFGGAAGAIGGKILQKATGQKD